LLLIGQLGKVHFFRHWLLLPIGWTTVQIVRQHLMKMTNTLPTTLSAILAASQSTCFSMHNYTPLVISWNDKDKQLTLLSQFKLTLVISWNDKNKQLTLVSQFKLAFPGRNMLMAL
jgi:hypothetical protein